MKLLLLICTFALSSCATNIQKQFEKVKNEPLMPKNERTFTTNIKTKLSKSEGYGNVMDWIAINFNDSKSVIKVSDKARGKIIGKGIISCEAVKFPPLVIDLGMGTKQNFGAVSQNLEFTLIVATKKGNVMLKFVDIELTGLDSYSRKIAYTHIPSNETQLEKIVKECIEPNIINEIKGSLK